MKISTIYTCNKCAHQSSKWLGKCPQCESWNSFSEEEVRQESKTQKRIKAHSRTPQEFEKIVSSVEREIRIPLGIGEVDRVLGAGFVPGSLVLLTGEPGIGKSTLTIQIADKMADRGMNVLYCSGEESEQQIALRGSRLGLKLKNLKLLNETNLETTLATAEEEKIDFLIIDSIQVMTSANIPGGAGSISQVRLCTEAIMEFAKPRKITVLLIGHVTKDGTLAGPRVLEHLVDVVLYLEGDRMYDLRMLRGVKNRFGGVSEVGIFELTEKGLHEVKNPLEHFIQTREAKAGVSIVCALEGTRPLFVEVQALVSATRFGYPRRTASGFDVNRLNLLIAVIERHLKIDLGQSDVFINVVGGLRLQEPAADLGIILAILSSLKNKPLPKNLAMAGEAGLSGEVRSAPKRDRREKECKAVGFKLLCPPQTVPENLATLISTVLRS